MTTWIAKRKLLVSKIGESERSDRRARIGRPHLPGRDMVNFEFHDGAAGCTVEIIGLERPWSEEMYGADSLQALQLASDIEPIVKRLSRKHDLFFLGGEPYFEEACSGRHAD